MSFSIKKREKLAIVSYVSHSCFESLENAKKKLIPLSLMTILHRKNSEQVWTCPKIRSDESKIVNCS